MINLILAVLVFCSSLGATVSKINYKVQRTIKAPRKHTQFLTIDKEVV